MRTLVVYGGRFQPFHKGHKASYDNLVKQFGAGNVYIASADKPQDPENPFTWDQKKKLAEMLGVPADKFVKVKNAYVVDFIKDAIPFNPEDTVLILAVSEKDATRLVSKNVDKEGYALKKNGQRAPIQWLRDNPGPVSAGHFYVTLTPTLAFKVAGKNVTGATQIRNMYADANDVTRKKILIDLYGRAAARPELKKMFDKNIGILQTESLIREFVEFVNNF